MKIATWNVNSVKARLGHVRDWLQNTSPDVLLLQELKTTAEAFPAFEFEALGYHATVAGQPTYNGVAILSRHPVENVVDALPGDDADSQARYVEGTVDDLRVISVYVPNGNPAPGPKYDYKLAWLARLRDRLEMLLARDEPFVIGGDFNVAPDDGDVFDPAAWANDALCRPESRAAFRRLLHLGLTDALRATSSEIGRYTWWDYRAGAWSRDQGLRIDHLLLSPTATDRLRDAGIDRAPRAQEKPSDHTPVWCEIDFSAA